MSVTLVPVDLGTRECVKCGYRTSEAESSTRIVYTGRCGRCRGELRVVLEKPDLPVTMENSSTPSRLDAAEQAFFAQQLESVATLNQVPFQMSRPPQCSSILVGIRADHVPRSCARPSGHEGPHESDNGYVWADPPRPDSSPSLIMRPTFRTPEAEIAELRNCLAHARAYVFDEREDWHAQQLVERIDRMMDSSVISGPEVMTAVTLTIVVSDRDLLALDDAVEMMSESYASSSLTQDERFDRMLRIRDDVRASCTLAMDKMEKTNATNPEKES